MSLGLYGCEPLRTWTDAAEAPPVGTIGFDDAGIYVLGRASTDAEAGSCVGLDKGTGGFGLNLASKGWWDAKHAIVVAQVGLATGDFGWALIYGYGMVRVLSGSAARTRLYTTSDGGVLGTASGSQTPIPCVTLTAARGTGDGPAPCVINKMFPRIR